MLQTNEWLRAFDAFFEAELALYKYKKDYYQPFTFVIKSKRPEKN